MAYEDNDSLEPWILKNPLHLGFGVEIEAAVEPLFIFYGQTSELADVASYYAKLADDLRKDGTRAEADDCVQYIKNHDYTKWWITRDGSVKPEDGCIAMEIVSPVLKSYENWEEQVAALWHVVKDNFKVYKNETAGTHVHVAPIDRSFKLCEMKAIAFACCYYEPYILSILPYERRNHRYCNRNSNVVQPMGDLVRAQSVCGVWTLREEINSLESVEQVCEFLQGGMKKEHRYVLWNFQNLARRTGTIEFRGGRHLRGPVKTMWWITFVVVFVSMAIDQNFVLNGPPEQIPQYHETGRKIETFWRRVLRYADSLALGANLPEDYRMMSGEMGDDEGSSEEEEEDGEESDSEEDSEVYIEEDYDNRW